MDDEALVARARTGDLTAADELLSLHQGGAYTAALRLVGVPADAEDIAQEALVRAYTRIADLREGASFGAWLRRIAVNLSLNALRHRGLLQFESLEPGHADPSAAAGPRRRPDDQAPSVEDEVISRALRDEIDGLVHELPVDQRVAVVLRDMYGFEVSEVAQLQRCGISAAKMRISRGRDHLRRRIAEVHAQRSGEG